MGLNVALVAVLLKLPVSNLEVPMAVVKEASNAGLVIGIASPPTVAIPTFLGGMIATDVKPQNLPILLSTATTTAAAAATATTTATVI